jgi:hypothetical protein
MALLQAAHPMRGTFSPPEKMSFVYAGRRIVQKVKETGLQKF